MNRVMDRNDNDRVKTLRRLHRITQNFHSNSFVIKEINFYLNNSKLNQLKITQNNMLVFIKI